MSILRFFGCVGKALAKNGLKVLAGLVPMSDVLFDVACEAFVQYKESAEGAKPQDLRKDVEAVAQVPPEQVKEACPAGRRASGWRSARRSQTADGAIPDPGAGGHPPLAAPTQ